MDPSLVTTAVPRPDTCPVALRATLERWKRGEATSAELREASARQGLDELEGCRWQRPLPVPAEIVEFRRLPPDQQAKGKATWQALAQRHGGFLTAERTRQLDNARHRAWLTELLAWAVERNEPPTVVMAVKHALGSHTVHG